MVCFHRQPCPCLSANETIIDHEPYLSKDPSLCLLTTGGRSSVFPVDVDTMSLSLLSS